MGTYQPTIVSHNNVLTHGTIQMLPCGKNIIVAWQYIMLPCGKTYYCCMAIYNVTMWQHMVPHVNIKWCHVLNKWLVKNNFYWLYFIGNIWQLIKGYWSKTLGKNTTLWLVKKTILVILDLLKSTCLKKLKGFFYTC